MFRGACSHVAWIPSLSLKQTCRSALRITGRPAPIVPPFQNNCMGYLFELLPSSCFAFSILPTLHSTTTPQVPPLSCLLSWSFCTPYSSAESTNFFPLCISPPLHCQADTNRGGKMTNLPLHFSPHTHFERASGHSFSSTTFASPFAYQGQPEREEQRTQQAAGKEGGSHFIKAHSRIFLSEVQDLHSLGFAHNPPGKNKKPAAKITWRV